MDPEIVDAPDAVAMHPATTRGKVRFHDVSFSYPTEAVPSQRAHDAVARGHDHDRLAEPEWAPEAELAFDATAEADGVDGGRDRRRRRRGPGRRRTATGRAVRPPAHRVHRRARRARRPRRAVGLGQDDDHLPRVAAVRRRCRRGRDRRRRRPQDQARVPRRGHRDGHPGDVPVPRVGQRQPSLRPPGGDRGRDRRRRDGRRDPRAGDRAAGGLRHDRRRARLQAVGRREAAHGDRPGAAQGPADPDPRRGDVGPRHRLGAAHPARLREPDGGPDDDRHRPPAVDDPARQPDHRVRSRPDRGTGTHAELLALDGLYARLYREQFLADDPAMWADAPLDPDEGDRDDDEPAPIALAGV